MFGVSHVLPKRLHGYNLCCGEVDFILFKRSQRGQLKAGVVTRANGFFRFQIGLLVVVPFRDGLVDAFVALYPESHLASKNQGQTNVKKSDVMHVVYLVVHPQ